MPVEVEVIIHRSVKVYRHFDGIEYLKFAFDLHVFAITFVQTKIILLTVKVIVIFHPLPHTIQFSLVLSNYFEFILIFSIQQVIHPFISLLHSLFSCMLVFCQSSHLKAAEQTKNSVAKKANFAAGMKININIVPLQ